MTSEKEIVTFRRLLLAKQLYQHGLSHSRKEGALNKMIAVHNFHNAIEILLRSVLLHYDIRPDKELNVTFEVMLNYIDTFKDFKEKGLKIPYRQQLMMLNQNRNHVQHHAVEPESSMMDEWRVFTHRFLENSLDNYFHLNFDEISPIDMLADDTLQETLKEALKCLKDKNLEKCLVLSIVSFQFASETLYQFIPKERTYFSPFSRPMELDGLIDKLEHLFERSNMSFSFSALLWSGISPVDYKKYKVIESCVSPQFADGGNVGICQ